ncbi:MAG TPA: tetratricopeptide repeat protein, partial [Candidatus Paceibacterota bacterium]|nr:tetratricopeptide repeat protein [Candidatus Paceibacterota bacterium]
MYALGAIIVGENELSAEIIEPIKDSGEYFLDDRFVYYYNEANDRAKLNDIHVKRVDYYYGLTQNNPENLENFLKLAEAQIALGQNVEAKKSLQVIIDLAKEEQKTLKTKAENLLQTI